MPLPITSLKGARCWGRWGRRPGTIPSAGEAAVARYDSGIGALQEAPAVPVIGPEVAGREDAAEDAALLPAGYAQVWIESADVEAAEVQIGLGAGVLQGGLARSGFGISYACEKESEKCS